MKTEGRDLVPKNLIAGGGKGRGKKKEEKKKEGKKKEKKKRERKLGLRISDAERRLTTRRRNCPAATLGVKRGRSVAGTANTGED